LLWEGAGHPFLFSLAKKEKRSCGSQRTSMVNIETNKEDLDWAVTILIN
jgi:hypothetical protein